MGHFFGATWSANFETAQRPEPGTYRIWYKEEADRPDSLGFATVVMLIETRCSDRTVAHLYAATYDSTGRQLATADNVRPRHPAVPGSVEWGFIAGLCGEVTR
jgi:hypothetical protein